MNAIGGLLFTAFLVVAMSVEQLATADGMTVRMDKDDVVQFRCDDGIIKFHEKKRRVYWVCEEDEGPPEPPVDPPPAQCGAPTYPVGDSKPLQSGQEIITLQQNRTTVRTFNSSQFDRGLNISWGPYSSGGPKVTSVSISECPGDFDIATLPKTCVSGAGTGQFSASVGGNGCKLKPDTDYVVNLAPHFITNGRYSCTGACRLTFFTAEQY